MLMLSVLQWLLLSFVSIAWSRWSAWMMTSIRSVPMLSLLITTVLLVSFYSFSWFTSGVPSFHSISITMVTTVNIIAMIVWVSSLGICCGWIVVVVTCFGVLYVYDLSSFPVSCSMYLTVVVPSLFSCMIVSKVLFPRMSWALTRVISNSIISVRIFFISSSSKKPYGGEYYDGYYGED